MLINTPEDFESLQIFLASPDKIRYWSYGEVEKPETINYRTFKPERKGLFCERIFGPVKDWECSCGKYRRIRYRGVVCERCGVEVTHSKVRRERMGHIELAAPVTHIWFLKGIPSYLALVLDLTARELEEVVYFDSFIVTKVDPSITDLKLKMLLSNSDYYQLKEKYGDKFSAEMGASAIKKLIENINFNEEIKNLRELIKDQKGQKKIKYTRQLKIFESFTVTGNSPVNMIMEALPVMPPDLRPMVQLEGGRFATSDLNDLYRRVVNRNNRLKRLIDIGAPEMIVRNEKRMLQEAVDVLIANGKRGRPVTGSNGRALKSLGNIIEGKQGRFRQNLLGKRVDYSGRSVIVVGPHLKFNQCGLPKEMALELFKPFIIRKLVEYNFVSNVKAAKRKIERKEVEVWDVLEEIIQDQPVLLNRAPTLHRLGIQAFDPVLVEGSAIQIHPLVCTAFNADFDGDQMAVHIPLSLEAHAECRMIIMSSNNILSPSNGRPIVTPTQDMVLGVYYLTVTNPAEDKNKVKFFRNVDEVIRAYEAGIVSTHSNIIFKKNNKRITTTVGRVIINQSIWDVFREFNLKSEEFVNYTIGKKQLSSLIYKWFKLYGTDFAGQASNKLKDIGFKYATKSGITISIDDLRVPDEKKALIFQAEKDVAKIEELVSSSKITSEEAELRSHDIWRRVSSDVSDAMAKNFGELNNVFIMANSGARGNIDQVRQLAGMRGLMSDAQGNTVKVPIKSNFKQGLSIVEYFISCYGARKGLVDTALRTADSGYLTRRLVDVAQEVTIREEDCGSTESTALTALMQGVNVIIPLSEIIEGRIVTQDYTDDQGENIIKSGEMITAEIALKLEQSGLKSVNVRTVFNCKTERGVCQKCYGLDLASAKIVNIGEAVGVIAAQSIGEPGTQLTMRTFHTGGVDLRKASQLSVKTELTGKVNLSKHLNLSKLNNGNVTNWVSINESTLTIESKDSSKTVKVPSGATLKVKENQSVKEGDVLFEYNPFLNYVVSNYSGECCFIDLIVESNKDSVSLAKEDGEIFIFTDDKEYTVELTPNQADGLVAGKRLQCGFDYSTNFVITQPAIVKKVTEVGKKVQITYSFGVSYPIRKGSEVYVNHGDKVMSEEILSGSLVSSDETSKTSDIVSGLPLVEMYFEARKQKSSAVLSEISGVVDIVDKGLTKLIVVIGEDLNKKEYKVPGNATLKVYTGQTIEVGTKLTEGTVNPHDILQTQGVEAVQKYLVDEVLTVYKTQGVSIHPKHVELIARQMTNRVIIQEMGDGTLLPNEVVHIQVVNKINKELESQGKDLIEYRPILQGVTRASITTDSVLSAASFQETGKVLSRAALYGEVDHLKGLKECVIIGSLIKAGTGYLGQSSKITLNAS